MSNAILMALAVLACFSIGYASGWTSGAEFIIKKMRKGLDDAIEQIDQLEKEGKNE